MQEAAGKGTMSRKEEDDVVLESGMPERRVGDERY
jgi:hypothetical protein